MFERQLQHHIPALLLLWRAAGVAMHTSARRVADNRARKLSAAVSRGAQPSHPTLPVGLPTRSSTSRLPLPSNPGPHAASQAGTPGPSRSNTRSHGAAGVATLQVTGFTAAGAGAVAVRSMAHWTTAARSGLFTALRRAAPLAAGAVGVAVGSHGFHLQGGTGSAAAPSMTPAAHHASQGLAAGAAAAPPDMRTARELLEAKGYSHPGLQPGAVWGSIPPSGGARQGGEVHVMFEYLLLFPA